ncbi:MAG TPA: CotH kinase family protein, partial [Candidatus Eisenbacteria bacterium]|nr:CotH kinase family protein [Candidatus Eisenbacteria bacterium]
INGLNRKSGADQWEFIKQNFNVEEMASYFAVNMCLQNWDGFFNNYFAYHDTGGTGKWEMYPWDEDKTWGDYDGASRQYDWYEMPLTYGMNGDRSPGFNPLSRALNQGNPFGNGVSWWRQPGYFSGPLLANPEFRKLFLARLREICTAIFTEEKMFPIFDAMEKRLEPEVRVRAAIFGEDPGNALRVFHNDMQSFRNQVQNRRKFILSELSKER